MARFINCMTYSFKFVFLRGMQYAYIFMYTDKRRWLLSRMLKACVIIMSDEWVGLELDLGNKLQNEFFSTALYSHCNELTTNLQFDENKMKYEI